MNGEEQEQAVAAVPDALRLELHRVLYESLDSVGVQLPDQSMSQVVDAASSLIGPIMQDLSVIAQTVVSLSRHADSLPITYEKISQTLVGLHELAEMIAGPEPDEDEG